MQYTVKSSDSKSDRTYTVEAHDSGKWWSCTCPHWQWRLRTSKGRCKHIDHVIAHNAEQERLQEDAMKKFETNGTGDWFDGPSKPDEEEELSEEQSVSVAMSI